MVSKSLFQVGRPEGERSLPRQPLDNLRVIINSPEVVKITWIYGLFDINLTKELWLLDQYFCCRLKCKIEKLWRVTTFQGYYKNVNQRWLWLKQLLNSCQPSFIKGCAVKDVFALQCSMTPDLVRRLGLVQELSGHTGCVNCIQVTHIKVCHHSLLISGCW